MHAELQLASYQEQEFSRQECDVSKSAHRDGVSISPVVGGSVCTEEGTGESEVYGVDVEGRFEVEGDVKNEGEVVSGGFASIGPREGVLLLEPVIGTLVGRLVEGILVGPSIM